MTAAKDILEELEEIGATGTRAVSTKLEALKNDLHDEVVIETGPPHTRLRDERGPQMVELCERAISLLETSVGALVELAEVFSQMRDVWTTEEESVPEEVLEAESPAAAVALAAETSQAEIEVEEQPMEEAREEEPPMSESTPPIPMGNAAPFVRPEMSQRRKRFLEQLQREAGKKENK